MTKETKIGLLVGLAFIVLFAIILSERGTTHRDTRAPAFAFMDQSKNASNVTADQPLGDMGRLPVETQLAPIVRPSTTRVPVVSRIEEERVEERVQPPPSREDQPLEELPAELVNSLNLPRVVDPTVRETPADLPTTIEHKVAMGGARPGEEPVTGNVPSAGSNAAQDPTQTKPPITRPVETSAAELDRIAKQVGIRTRTVHEVQPGESLGKIAAKYYGRSTPARVEALFEANRDVLKDPGSVRANTSLKIPDLGEGFEPAPSFVLTDPPKPTGAGRGAKDREPSSPADSALTSLVNVDPGPGRGAPPISNASPINGALRIPMPIPDRRPGDSLQLASSRAADGASARSPDASSSGRRSEPAGREAMNSTRKPNESAPMAFRWYEVQPRDTLSRIARREMGGERHVNSLFEINQDILKSRHTLKPGMRIRVPAKVAGSSERTNVQSARGNGDGEP